jgi:hypothetical protein
MTTHTPIKAAAAVDHDILAVQALMAKEQAAPAPEPVRQTSRAPKTAQPDVQGDTPKRKKSFRLDIRPRHVAVVALAAFAVFRPGLMLAAIALLLSPVFFLLIYVAFVGVDGFWTRARALYLRIKARNPALAKRLHSGFYSGAGSWDAMIDRLPGKMPDAAYAPDFQAQAAADAAHERALDKRFARLREEMGA